MLYSYYCCSHNKRNKPRFLFSGELGMLINDNDCNWFMVKHPKSTLIIVDHQET